MNIAIDITALETAHGQRGVGSYTRNLVEALQKYEKNYTYSLFTRKQKIPNNVNLVHYPYFDPFFLTLPLMKTKPTVVTVHDLIPLVFPDKFPTGIKGTFKWQIQKHSLLGAKRIITDSQCSRDDIARITGIDRDRIDVVYLAPDPMFQPVSRAHIDSTRKKFSLTKPYFLYVGDVNWNKNILGLVRAFASISNYFLVLVGGAFTNASLAETKEINRLVSALGIGRSIRRIGHVANHDLAGLYCGAVVLIQPSFYEGFGLPVLEGLACGCPVVSSDLSSLGEILGPSIRIRPDDVASIAAGMRKAAGMSSQERSDFARQGKEWTRTFTWRKVARETVASYERAVK